MQWLKPHVEFNAKKKIRSGRNYNKVGKALYKLMNNIACGKIMETLRNKTDVRLVSNKKDYLKWTSKSNCISHKIFENDLLVTGFYQGYIYL